MRTAFLSRSGLLTGLATALFVVSGCGDDGSKKLDQLEVGDLSLTTPEDTPLVVALPIEIAAGRTVDVTVTTKPMHGDVAMGSDAATWMYTPAANYDGSDSFSVALSDGTATGAGTISITVTPVDDAPVAGSDSFAAAVDTPLVVAATTLLANDTDIEGDTLTVTAVEDATNGSVVLSGASVTFTPASAFTGSASFTYTLSDGQVTSIGHVAVTVGGDNPPVAVADTATTAEDTAIVLADSALLGNDSDPDHQTLAIASVGNPTHGTAVHSGAATTFTPDPNFNGTATFDYTVTDGAATATATVTITVTPVEDAPIANPDTATTAEDTAVTIATADLLANDTDADGDTITIVSVTPLAHGGPALSQDGATVTFTPDPNFNGDATFAYTITDGTLTGTGTVTVTVTPVNDPPVAVDDTETTLEDTPLVVSSASLLANDVDVDGDTLTLTGVTNAQNGTVLLDPQSGTITFTPAANFFGAASFDYTVSDPSDATDTGTVNITVVSVNDPPIANPDSATIDEDTSATIAVTANDTDADGDALTVVSFTQGAHGAVTFAANVATYTPAANFNGTDGFSYQVSDGNGGIATGTVSITIKSVNDAPVANDDTLVTNEDTAGSVNVLANDTDVDGDTITITSHTTPAHGAVVLAGGVATYTPAANYNGPDAFTYTVTDGHGGNATGTVSITVVSVNDPPVAKADSITTKEDTAASLDVVANDTDVDGDTLAVSSFTQPGHGTVSFAGNTATYTPAANYNGPDLFTYTIADGNGGNATATVSITVTPVNDNPVAGADKIVTAEDTAGSVDVITNDSDVDGDTLTITGHTNGAHGTVAFTGTVATYTPAANFNGADSFTYTLSDGNGGNATGTVSVTVTPVNDPPVAVNDSITTNEDTAASVNVLANDSDVDGDTLTISAHTNPTKGTLVFNGGLVTFTPSANLNGADSFMYTISDGHGGNATATVAITITPVNDAPVAKDDTLTTAEDTAGTVNVIANDTDVDGDTLTVSATTNGAHGTVTFSGVNVTYTPAANFNGTDSFTYTVADGHGGTDTGAVAVTVTAVNDPPVAKADSLTTAEDTVGTVNVLANDTDVDGDTLTVSAFTQPTHGSVAITTAGVATYTPAANFHGSDSFQYTANDGHGGTSNATVSVTVTSVNDPPVAVDDSITTNEDTAGSVNVLANDTDVDGDTLVVASHTNGAKGTVTFSGGVATYTPAANTNGTDSFTYIVSDGHGGTATGTVHVTVTPVNDPPVANADTEATDEDTVLTFAASALAANDTDVDGDTLTVTAVQSTATTHGTVALASGSVTYTPAKDFNGTSTFTYTVSDGNGGTDTGTVTVTVNPVNDAPVAGNDTASTNEDTALTLTFATLLANDTDVDGDKLTITSAGTATSGTVVLSTATKTITYTPSKDFNGTDSFTYVVSDGNGGTDTGTVSLTINPVNDAPVAVVDSGLSVTQGLAADFDVLANDTDVDGDTLAPVIVTQPKNGTVSINGTKLHFAPNPSFSGADTFQYQASDGKLVSNTITDSVTVTADQPPVASDQSVNVTQNTESDIELGASDPDTGDTLTYAIVTPTAHGTLINFDAAAGLVTYVPDTDFTGRDSFTFQAKDNHGVSSNLATVQLAVTNGEGGFCGDGTVGPTEQCDDGNNLPGDGCEADCTLTCGGDGGADIATVDPTTGHCYAGFEFSTTSFQNAAQQCTNLGGYLPVVTTATEQTAVIGALPRSGGLPYLGGLGNSLAELHWITGETFGFTAFAANQPQFVRGSSCLQLDASGEWTVGDCTQPTAGFECEFNLLPETREDRVDAAVFGVALADLDGDGNLDAAVTTAKGTLDILRGDGAGGFFPETTLTSGNGLHGVALADVDHDKNVDAIVANGSDNTISVFFGAGGGTFADPITVAVGTNPNAVVIGDITGDGLLDVAVSNTTSGTVTVFIGDGTRGFTVVRTINLPRGAFAQQLALVDMNNDKILDVVVADSQGKAVDIAFGTANNSFGPPVAFPAGIAAASLVAADFTGDGFADVAVADNLSGAVVILKNDGKGSLGVAATQTSQATAAVTLAVALRQGLAAFDFNQDNQLDLVLANGAASNAALFHGDGAGGFTGGHTFQLGSGPFALAIGDLDGDTVPELVAGQADGTLGVIIDPDDESSYDAPFEVALDSNPTALAVGDFNGDGHADFATGDTAGNVSISITDEAGFTVTVVKTGANPVAIVTADVLSVGHVDLAVITEGDARLTLFLNDGNGVFTERVITVPGSPNDVGTGDFNGDGHTDFIVTDANGKQLTELLGDGKGTFAQRALTFSGTPTGIAIGDANGDGAPDVLISTSTGVSTLLNKNDQTGNFALKGATATGAGPINVVVGDFNHDKKLDFATADGAGSVTIGLGDGAGNFKPTRIGNIGVPRGLVAADVNGDANLDVAVTTGSSITLLFGQGDGTFAPATGVFAHTPTAIAAGDLDADGHGDLVVTDSAEAQATVLVSPR